jgi:hypothetical protein
MARKGKGFTSLIFIWVFRINSIFISGKPNPTGSSRNSCWLKRYDMGGISQIQGGKNRILPKETNANRFF